MTDQELIESLAKIGIDLTPEKQGQLNMLYEYMVEENKKLNLTRITQKEEVNLKHFYDSLTLQKIVNLNEVELLCDVGTGAGFPGIVLKIIFPNIEVTLVDSLEKRVKYLNRVIEKLGLQRIKTVHKRGEDFAKEHREMFDIVTSRAVASMRVISEISIPMVKVNGYFVAMKGNISEELQEAEKTIQILNAEIDEICEFFLPCEKSKRTLIKIRKKEKTNKKYPRSIDKIKKISL